jgi:hypothetical protein
MAVISMAAHYLLVIVGLVVIIAAVGVMGRILVTILSKFSAYRDR